MAQNLITKHIIEAVVKPTLDKGEREKLNSDLSKIFADAANIDFNTKETRDNLNNLAKAFKAIFDKIGDTSIDFEQMIKMPPPEMFAKLGEVAAKQFWNAWDSVAKSQTPIDFSAELEKLNKQKDALIKKQNQARQAISARSRMDRLENFRIDSAKLISVDGDIGKEAQKIVDEIYSAADNIDEARKKFGSNSAQYTNAVLDAQEAYNTYLRMQQTLKSLSNSELFAIPKEVRALYDMKNDLNGQLEDFAAEKILDLFDELSDTFEASVDAVTKIDKQLASVEARIAEISRQAKEAGSIDSVISKDDKDGLKTLNEIEAAYKRILTTGKKRAARPDQKKLEGIEKSLAFDPEQSKKGIKSLYDEYLNASESGNWEDAYQALLKYVRLYESYQKSENQTHRNKVSKPGNEFTSLYEQLKPMAANAENALRNVVNMAKDMPLVEVAGAKKDEPQMSVDATNAERVAESNKASAEAEMAAREEAEKKVDIDKKAISASGQQTANNEASVDMAKEELDLAKQRVQVLEQLDQIYRENAKPGQRIETAAQIDSKTGAVDRFTVGDKDGAKLPGSIVEDTEWGQQKPHLDTGLHTHWTDTAAPSPKDLQTFKDRLNYQRLEIIRAMQEALFLDFSKISDTSLNQLIDEYSKVAEQIQQQFESMPIAERIKQFGGLDQHYEQMQVKLKEAFVNLAKDTPGFAEYVQKPMWPESSVVAAGEKSEVADTAGTPLADEYARANDEVKELIKNYAILTRNMSHNIGDASTFDQLDHLEDKIEEIAPELLKITSGQWKDFGEQLINEDIDIEDVTFERVKQEVVATENAVDGLNESLEQTKQLMSGGGTGDASLADLEAERAKSEALQDELDNRIGALQAAHDEKEMLQSDLNIANEQIKIAQDSEVAARARADETDLKLIEKDKQIQDLEERLAQSQAVDGDAIFSAEQRANEAEERAAMYDRAMTSMQAEMADLRGKLADAKTGTGEDDASVKAEELKTLLNSIVYNVKIAHDDNDKAANKIAFDESTLEATLTKVFANILNPQAQQNDSEQTEKNLALESTLQTVKAVLDNIDTNTTKIGTVQIPNVDTITGTALDGRLTEIKAVLESINSKIAKGGVIATRGAVKQANAQPVESEAKAQAARSNMMKSLINDYKTMGKLAAQFANDGNLETQAMLENLKEEIARKRQSLRLTMDENKSLREKYSIAFDAEKRLLDAEKAQKEINAQNKADAKEAEASWKKQVKDAQRATGINAATTAANAGDQTVVRAIGTEGVSKDVENKAKELSAQIKTLRALRDEIDKKGNQASDADRDNLSKQIAKVKELKTEVDGYLKIHEKYSGEGVTDLRVDTSNFGAVGTDQYWNNITAAIQKASTGRVAIKSMNADTGELTGTTKIAANTFAQWTATVDPLTGRLSMLRTGIKRTETIIEQIKRKTKEIFTYFSGSSMIFKAVNTLKKGIQYVRDIDLALTELKKVTDETEEAYDKFLQTAAKTGARLGSTISAVTEATATFAKLGYSMKQASEMAEAAIVYKNVGDNIASTEDAADSIISTLKGFGLEASESMAIVDKFNEVGNRFAITSQGIGEALRLSASALNEGRNSLDESIGLITAANEVVNDPSSVGTALKTLTLRLRGSKTELEEMGEDVSDMATTTSQLQAKLLALTGGKVDIMLDANTFKNSTQILREMAAAWEDMTDIQRAEWCPYVQKCA